MKTKNYQWSKINGGLIIIIIVIIIIIIIIMIIIIMIIMEYQKMMNLLDDTTNQPSRFRTRDWVEINDESKERYNSNITFKAFVAKSNLCDCSDAYILVKGTIIVSNAAAVGAAVNNTNNI